MGSLKRLLKNIYLRNINFFNYFPIINKIRLNGADLLSKDSRIWNCKVVCHGIGNRIELGKNVILKNCVIQILGDKNTVFIDDNVLIINGTIWIEDNNNSVTIGKNTSMTGTINLACIEGTSINIGDSCLFSSEITIRTGDSHSILNMEGIRTNYSQNVSIGNHVWVGNKVIINKGCIIPNDCVVGAGAILTKQFDEKNTVIAGVPGQIVKREVNWSYDRI